MRGKVETLKETISESNSLQMDVTSLCITAIASKQIRSVAPENTIAPSVALSTDIIQSFVLSLYQKFICFQNILIKLI